MKNRLLPLAFMVLSLTPLSSYASCSKPGFLPSFRPERENVSFNLYKKNGDIKEKKYGKRVVRIRAKASYSTIKCGSKPSNKMRKVIKEIGKDGDIAGHIVSERLGGRGTVYGNIAPMSRSANAIYYNEIERYIYKCLINNKGAIANLDIRLYYTDSIYPMRPTKIKYSVRFEKTKKCSKKSKYIYL